MNTDTTVAWYENLKATCKALPDGEYLHHVGMPPYHAPGFSSHGLWHDAEWRGSFQLLDRNCHAVGTIAFAGMQPCDALKSDTVPPRTWTAFQEWARIEMERAIAGGSA